MSIKDATLDEIQSELFERGMVAVDLELLTDAQSARRAT